MRTASQMISYEVTMGLTIIGVLMVYGSMQLTQIGAAQETGYWGIFLQPLGFVMFFAASIAENKRVPFDAPEAESELVAGYFTEYSGLKFGMFFMAEFIEMVTIGAIMTILFFGAWHIPFLPTATLLSMFDFLGDDFANLVVMLIHVGVFFGKVTFFIFVQMVIRWTLPRFRYDQIMKLGWKILLPLSLANIVVTGIVILALN
jgi:NADH-quinone oxidoreductase subunit H